jgi:pimeloyl-ACP methyl ester carboxylesterase
MTHTPHEIDPLATPSRSPRSQSALTLIKQNKAWLIGGAVTAALAGSALLNRANSRRAEAETPPSGKFVVIDDVSLHYSDQGDGPAVVLLHGNGMTLQDYEVSGVTGLVAQNHRVIAFDRPGFGYSDRPRTTAWTPEAQAQIIGEALNQIGVQRAVVVGHSWGTLVALAMALNHPEAVAGLVLLSGYYFATRRSDVIPLSLPALPLAGDVAANTVVPIIAAITGPAALKASFSPAPISDKFASFPAAMSLRPSQVRAAAADTALMIPGAAALSPRYGDLDLPVVIMAGEGDKLVYPANHAMPLAQVIPGAELRMVPDEGHFLHYGVPEQVAAAIDDVTDRASF